MSKQAPDTDELLTLFYEKYAKILVQPIESIEIKPMALKGGYFCTSFINSIFRLIFYE